MNLLKIAALLLLCNGGQCQAQTGGEPSATTPAGFDLKPGFYGEDPDLKELTDHMGKADLKVILSGLNGISIGAEDNLTLERALSLASAVKEKHLVVIHEEKNFTDSAVEAQVQQMLVQAGFQEVLTAGMHSSGTWLRSYTKHSKPVSAAEDGKRFFVGGAADPEKWPYQYTLVRDAKDGWSGEIEFQSGDSTLFFDKITVMQAEGDKIRFAALTGRPGKALLAGWELALTKSPEGYDGVLAATNAVDEFEPVRLKLLEKADAVMPSTELAAKLLAMDDESYRSEEALLYEVALAKRAWEREAPIAARIAELRGDDKLRGGIRREWTGPAWVRERLKPEEAKYFERICCVYLGGSAVTDEDVQAICGLTELRELLLHSTTISDAGLEKIDRLQGLKVLHLKGTLVTGQSFEKLKTLVNLKELYLEETGIPEEDCQRLQAALPDTQVTW